jgi:hypothetical protein
MKIGILSSGIVAKSFANAIKLADPVWVIASLTERVSELLTPSTGQPQQE